MALATSKGSFFNRHIRGRFPNAKLPDQNEVALGFSLLQISGRFSF